MKVIKVKVELKETSQPIEVLAINTYTKGPFYCIFWNKLVYKFPLDNIWRITEEYTGEEYDDVVAAIKEASA